jgi:hypothetical protein
VQNDPPSSIRILRKLLLYSEASFPSLGDAFGRDRRVVRSRRREVPLCVQLVEPSAMPQEEDERGRGGARPGLLGECHAHSDLSEALGVAARATGSKLVFCRRPAMLPLLHSSTMPFASTC